MSRSDSNPSHVDYPSDDSPAKLASSSSRISKQVSKTNVPPVGTSSGDLPFRSQVSIVPDSIVHAKTERALLLKDLRPAKLKATETKKLPHLFCFNPLIPFRFPEKNERLDSYSVDTVALSIEAFRYASYFPVPQIIEQLCLHFDI